MKQMAETRVASNFLSILISFFPLQCWEKYTNRRAFDVHNFGHCYLTICAAIDSVAAIKGISSEKPKRTFILTLGIIADLILRMLVVDLEEDINTSTISSCESFHISEWMELVQLLDLVAQLDHFEQLRNASKICWNVSNLWRNIK